MLVFTANLTAANIQKRMTRMTNARTYTTVFFDLDGTLLPMDTDVFLRGYMKGLGIYMAEHGLDAEKGMKALMAGVKSMGNGEEPSSNAEKFWTVFESIMGMSIEEGAPFFLDFYNGPFNAIAEDVQPNPSAARAIRTLKAKGYRLAVTTMPMFPVQAVHNRLRWAGLDPQDFMFVTDYETNTSVKPYARFYEEALQRAGVDGSQVLMVGNHNLEDGAATKLGCDLYLVTDHLLTAEGGTSLDECKHGSMEDFARFCDELPSLI